MYIYVYTHIDVLLLFMRTHPRQNIWVKTFRSKPMIAHNNTAKHKQIKTENKNHLCRFAWHSRVWTRSSRHICLFIYIHTCIDTYMYAVLLGTHVPGQEAQDTYASLHTYIHVYCFAWHSRDWTRSSRHICLCIYIHTYIHTNMHAHACIPSDNPHTYIHTYIHIYIHRLGMP